MTDRLFWIAAAVSLAGLAGFAFIAWESMGWYLEGSAYIQIQRGNGLAVIGGVSAVLLSLAVMVGADALRRRGAGGMAVVMVLTPLLVLAVAALGLMALSVPPADVLL